MHSIHVSQLFIYPVKSLRGIAVEQAELTPLGLKYDRHWMIVDDKQVFVTQRKHPQMVLIKTRINNEFLFLSKDGMKEIQIRLNNEFETSRDTYIATVWKDECQVQDEGDAVSEWLMQALGSKKPLRLVRMAQHQKRPQSKPERFGADNTTQFADAVAYLICNQRSLDKLNHTLQDKGFEQASMEQFRPNIILDQNSSSEINHTEFAPFAEHTVKEFIHTNYSLRSHDHCQRCIVPTIHLETGEKHPKQEPYKTLVELNPMPNQPKAPAFGQNATLKHANETQCIKVGDAISVI